MADHHTTHPDNGAAHYAAHPETAVHNGDTHEDSPSKSTHARWTQAEKATLVEAFIELAMKDMHGHHDKWDVLAKATGKTVKQCQDQFNPNRSGVRHDIRRFLTGK